MPDIFVSPQEKSKPTSEVNSALVKELPEQTKTENGESQGGSLAAYALYPDNVRFDTQAEEEKIIILLRRHWVTNLSWLFIAFIFVFVPPIVFPVFTLNHILPSLPANFMLVGALIWYLAASGYILVNFITWYFNVYIVTNERIIDVDFYQLLYKKLASTRIARVQDITYKLGGVLRSIFDFGDVFVQTAGTEENFTFEAIPHPEAVVRQISELLEKEEHQAV